MTKPILGGKPLKFKTRKELIDKINQYFSDTEKGELTVTGLALVLGSKQLIQDYEKRDGFSDIIQQAKLFIENDYELDLRKNGGAHNIFALKNFGWKDKIETETYGKDGGPIKTENVIEFVEADASKTP